MKKIITLIFVLVGFISINNFVYSYSSGCAEELADLNNKDSEYRNCKNHCLENEISGDEILEGQDPNDYCANIYCNTEKHSLDRSQNTYNACKTANQQSCNWGVILQDGTCCPAWNKAYNNKTECCIWTVVPDSENPGREACITNTVWNMWMNMDPNCLINWQCSYNIYKTVWIRKSNQNPTVSSFVQDVILWATTFMGTVITVVLIISWILYILAAILWKSNLADMAKKWIFNSILWLLLVSWSYALVRLIQFVATGGS